MKSKKFHYQYILLLFLLSAYAWGDDGKISLTVYVDGAIPGKGRVMLSLFSSAASYMKKPHISIAKSVGNTGQVQFALQPLEPGTYALSVIYDEDSNGKLNTGFLGVPTELVGFSNNVRGLFGPPDFAEAAFLLSTPQTIHINLSKAKD